MLRNFFKFLTKPYTLNAKPSSSPSGQRGQVAMLLIIVMVIAFAIMMSGGAGSLFTGNEPSSVTPTPPEEGEVVAPTPTPAPWDIIMSLEETCREAKFPFKQGKMIVNGLENGYVKLEINDGGFKTHITQPFLSPSSIYDPLIFKNEDGFNTKDWKVTVYSGGTLENGNWTGGTEKTTIAGQPTGC